MLSVAVNISHTNPLPHTYANNRHGRQRAFYYNQNCIRMKKFLFLSALIALLIGCKSKDEPQQQVTFRISNFQSTTEPLGSPRKAPASLIDDGDALTDIYLFDGATQLVHQTSTQEDFGTITVLLTVGEHNLHFIATRSTGLAVEEGLLVCSSLKNTFGKTVHLNVSGGGDQNITLDRLTGKLIISINDEVPSGASNLYIRIGSRYTTLDPQTLFGVNPTVFEHNANLTSRIGHDDYQISLFILAPDEDGYETTFTLTATNTSSQVIGQATGTITIAPNTKTLLSGNLFTGTRSFISLNSAWNADIEENF